MLQVIQRQNSLYTRAFHGPWPRRISTVARKSHGNSCPKQCPTPQHFTPLNATDLTLLPSLPSGSSQKPGSIEDRRFGSGHGLRESVAKHEKSDKSYWNDWKVVWIAGDPLSTNFPLPREGCSRSILIFHPLERGVKQGGTHCAGGGLIEVTWCLRSDVIPASLPPAVISFVLRRSSAVNPYVSLFLTICCSTVLGEISVGDYREAAFLRVHEGNPYVHCSRLG